MTEFDRRQFMRRAGGVAVGGATAWTVPTIVSINPADAATHAGSAPPSTSPPPEIMTPPITEAPKPEPRAAATPPGANRGSLPFTGDDEEREGIIAAAALAAGVAFLAKGDRRPQLDDRA